METKRKNLISSTKTIDHRDELEDQLEIYKKKIQILEKQNKELMSEPSTSQEKISKVITAENRENRENRESLAKNDPDIPTSESKVC